VILETANFVAIAGLGPLAEGYVLVVTRVHVSCIAAAPTAWGDELEELRRTIATAQRGVYGASFFFEHGRSGACLPEGEGEDHCYHAHLHLVASAVDLPAAVSQDHRLVPLRDWQHLIDHYAQDPLPYIMVERANGGIGYVPTPKKLPRHYLRTKTAELLGVPELADCMAFPRLDVVERGRSRLSAVIAGAEPRRSGHGHPVDQPPDRWDQR
jgi:diadenosine tetraphosphate (Ap4A) HIT family hydrolase